MSKGKMVLGVLAGVAAGTLLGVAITPKRSKSQKKLTQKGADLADALQAVLDERFKNLLDQVEERIAKKNSASLNESARNRD